MQIRSRTWALIVWLQMLRAVRGQAPTDCALQAFLEGPLFDGNFDTSTLQPSYAAGRQVQVSCRTGYSGSFKLICVEGKWQARGSKCEQTKCHLPSTQLEGTSYDPAHITLFSTGTSVTVQCGDAHWIVNPQQRSAVSTCLDGGEWSIRPSCREVTCSNTPDENVYSWSVQWWETKRLGDAATYRCRPGFRSNNSASEMTCTRDGWQPNPACEDVNAQVCPMIHPDNTVVAIGDLEEANFGKVVRFRCKSNSQILNGPVEIYCNEDGEWSSQPPRCGEVKCQVPVIKDGVVTVGIRDYNENEILQFVCQSGYKRTDERPSTCTKTGGGAGWVPAPECEEVRCSLPLARLEGTSYEPAHITRFSPGTSVTVQCGDTHWIGSPKQRSAVLTCLENGQWSRDETVCQEVTCRNWRDRNVHYWSVRWGETKRLGDKATYRCRPGFRSTNAASEMICTRNGWEPNPPCEAAQDCEKAPPLPGGDTRHSTRLQYQHGERVEYVCSRYHVMEGGPFKTCQNAEWIGDIRCLRPCTVDRDLMNQYHITFRYTRDDKVYSEPNDVIEFMCVRGKRPSSDTPMRQRCIDGQITLPSCQ